MANFSEEWLAGYQAKRHGAVIPPPVVSVAPIPPETRTISLALSVPPSVNKMFANVPGVGRVKTDKYREWLTIATGEAIAGMIWKGMIKGKFKATMHIAARGDLDNRIKATVDLCVMVGAVEDDVHLVELHVYRQSGTPGVWITIEAVDFTDVRSVASP